MTSHKGQTAVIELDPKARAHINGVAAGQDGAIAPIRIPFLTGRVNRLPEGWCAAVVAADLQARSPGPEQTLLGVVAAETTVRQVAGMGLSPGDVGVLLCGDFWARPNEEARRGGYGDVRPVWDAFADRFRCVIGVPGNHDLFEANVRPKPNASSWRENVAVVCDGVVNCNGLRVGGLAGCVGRATLPFRETERDQQRRLERVLSESPDVLLLHQGPRSSERSRPGAAMISRVLQSVAHPLVVFCGHDHWDDRLMRVGTTHVLNVHEAVCLLLA